MTRIAEFILVDSDLFRPGSRPDPLDTFYSKISKCLSIDACRIFSLKTVLPHAILVKCDERLSAAHAQILGCGLKMFPVKGADTSTLHQEQTSSPKDAQMGGPRSLL